MIRQITFRIDIGLIRVLGKALIWFYDDDELFSWDATFWKWLVIACMIASDSIWAILVRVCLGLMAFGLNGDTYETNLSHTLHDLSASATLTPCTQGK